MRVWSTYFRDSLAGVAPLRNPTQELSPELVIFSELSAIALDVLGILAAPEETTTLSRASEEDRSARISLGESSR